MNKSILKSIVMVVALALVFLGVNAKIASADTAQLDLNSLESIGTGELSSTPTPTPVETATPTPTTTTTVTTNNKESKLPTTGSNTEIIFAVGVVVLTTAAVVTYKKIKF